MYFFCTFRQCRVALGKGQVSRYQFDMRSHRFMISETVRLCLAVEMVPWGD